MVWPKSNVVLICTVLEIKQCMHECQKRDLVDLDTKLITSVGPVYKQQTSSCYCVANDNLCNVRRYCKLLMLQHTTVVQSELVHLAIFIPGRMAAIMLDFHAINSLVVVDVYRRCLQQMSTAHS
jgi:HJR/Mrr/RecB family endonuclease